MFDHETFLNVQARHGGKVISNISRFKVRKKFFKLEYGGKESRGIPENHENGKKCSQSQTYMYTCTSNAFVLIIYFQSV